MKRPIYKVLHEGFVDYVIYNDGSFLIPDTGEIYEYPSQDRIERITSEVPHKTLLFGKLEETPCRNEFELSIIRDCCLQKLRHPISKWDDRDIFVAPTKEESIAFRTLKKLGFVPDGVNNENIEVQYLGSADAPWIRESFGKGVVV